MITRGCLVLCSMSLIGFIVDSAILSSFSNQLPVPDVRVILPVLMALYLPNQVGVILSFLIGLIFDLLCGGTIGINSSSSVIVFLCSLVFLGNASNQGINRNFKRKTSFTNLFTGCLFAYFAKVAFENVLYSRILTGGELNISLSFNQFLIGFVTAIVCPLILKVILKLTKNQTGSSMALSSGIHIKTVVQRR